MEIDNVRLDTLTKESLSVIFSFLSVFPDLMHVSQVNKTLYGVVRHSFRILANNIDS